MSARTLFTSDELARAEGRPTRVLFLHGTLGIGGAEEVRLTLLRQLDPSRYCVTVCCLQEGGPIAEEIAALGYEVVVLGRRAHALSLPTLAALRRLIRERRPDIVHTSLPRANYWGRIAAALEGVPVVIAEEHTVSERADWARPLIESVLGNRTDCLLVVSETVREAVVRKDRGRGARPPVVAPNPVNAARLQPQHPAAEVRAAIGVGPRETLLLHVGRMDRVGGAKGHDLLLASLARLRQTHPHFVCALAGDGPARPELEAMARARGVADRVRFLGFRRDVADLLAAADLFVFPSRWEGMPIALMEAMWSGLPVIASDIAANREVLHAGQYGRLFPPASPAALAEGLAQLLSDRAGREQVAEAARRYARAAFSPARYAERVTGIWETLLVAHAARTLRQGARP